MKNGYEYASEGFKFRVISLPGNLVRGDPSQHQTYLFRWNAAISALNLSFPNSLECKSSSFSMVPLKVISIHIVKTDKVKITHTL